MGVASPMPAGALINIDPRVRMIQFSSMLNDDDLHRLASLLEARSDITLRAFGNYDGTLTNLDFLRCFPKLRRFIVDIYQLDNIDGLVHLPSDLHELGIGQTKKRMSMEVLRRFATLKRLWLEGHVKGIGVLSELSSLVDLSLRSATLPNLELLMPLRSLRLLDLKLGGTSDLRLLPSVGELEYLEIWMVRGLSDISMVGDVSALRYLFLQTLKNVTVLPDMARSQRLSGVMLWAMKGITDLSPLASAPNLTQLEMREMSHLQLSALAPFVDHPTLREATVLLGRNRNEAAAAMLQLPPVSGGSWRRDVAADHGV